MQAALDVACPRCGARPKQGCRSIGYPSGAPRPDKPVRAHLARLEAWRASLKGEQSLRGLALAIENVAREHPCYSQAYHIVSCCIDHLCAIAGFHEQNLKLQALERYRDDLEKKAGDKS